MYMKITKIDGVSHYKKQDKGILKKKWKDLDERKQREKIEARYNKQIESKIYKEFFRLKNKKRIEKEEDQNIKSLYFFIKELYLNEKNEEWELKNINLEILDDKERVIKGYKFKEDVYFFKEGYKEYYLRILFNNLIEKVQNENREKVRKNKEFLDLKEIFKKYKNRKIDLLLKSINNNKINLEYKKENVNEEIYGINPTNDREMTFYELLKEIIEKKDEQKSILEEKLDNFDITNFLENIEKIFNEETEINIIKGKVLNELREYIKEKEENNSDNKLKQIYNLELKKYIENNFSYKKQKSKSKNGKNDYLYLNFLKKIMFIEEVDEKKEINKEKFKNKINSNFKNLFVQHILDYGKLLYYKENDEYIKNTGQLETKDLEYIKTKETLIRKMAVLVSFAANSYYNLFGRVSGDILGTEVVKSSKTNVIKVGSHIFKEKMLNYFFDFEIFDANKIVEILESISYSIYNVRNGVGHFNKLILGKYKKKDINTNKRIEEDLNNNEEIKGYFIKKRGEIERKVKEKFLSNNLQYYYSKEKIENYFEVYEFEILKRKIPFAPNFKRIIKKGEDLFNNKNNKKYEYFKNFDKNSAEEKKEFLKTRNFLLKELYYNNFYKEFLSKKEEFEKIVLEVKEEKKSRGNINNKKSGVSFQSIDDYDTKINISDYIASIHKKEMERVEKYNEEKQKDTAKYIRDFVEEIFLTGFINYLEKDKRLHFLKEEFSILCNNNNNVVDFNININEEKIKEFLKENDSKTLNLYLFFNMIDSKRISEFRNELVKYKQFTKKRLDEEKEFLGIKIELYETLIEFVILTREKLDTKKSEEIDAWLVDKLYVKDSNEYKEYEEILKLFVDEKILSSKEAPYYATDNKTPILLSNFEKTRKYGTQSFLSEIQSNYKYSKVEKENIEDYNKKEEIEQKKKSNIEKLQDLKVELHKKWEQNKITEKEIEKYNNTTRKINEYNYLKNKEELQNVYLLHEMLSDLLARNVAFFNKWERDFKFIVIAIKQFLRENDKEKVNEFLNPPDNSKGKKVYFSVSKYKNTVENIDGIHKNFMNLIFLNNKFMNRKIDKMNCAIWVYFRNYIAHFLHLHTKNEKISLISQMNLLIKLFSYDKKVQNHILKSTKTLLEKYNIQINFEISNDKNEVFKYKIKNRLYSKKGKMLGKNNKFEILENEFLENVKAMLEYSE
ncbi:type VI-A CRISPR-associated RNA-guided ribonuclease Cas13a [Leptotrichia wadei]|uniref:CRISPR-associated endoribonuclease Cas13a n=1 Tax=Leptotrichia wadei (strain F0279) TaxID=888055 RepID=CS13A_LEPWF|nr:type VI-A CRISPR-associated RNA-guided ribonuclease Cas13a [Leptotrichia wadei]U2PSH1.1 RecName: Full=CRISPR-associated endoribonuclease Cas13a; Short=EndoRNase; AltName: Full=LwaCas13a [Leptotrichia wadei F0279]ERK53440.1 hypothetical protein HMPREF9015_00520 [Leptotrichia wadei F0279]